MSSYGDSDHDHHDDHDDDDDDEEEEVERKVFILPKSTIVFINST